MDRHSLKEIGAVLGAQAEGAVSSFAFDSRLVIQGGLFFALEGQMFDGHQFLKEVAAKGAVGAVVDKKYQGPSFGLKLVRVSDVPSALQKLAAEVQRTRKQKVVAVTGSVGKTTTKEFLAALLEKKCRVAKIPGNANSQVGFPLAILNAEGSEEIFVAEMGMNHEGEIARLVQIAPPDIAVLTNVGRAHIGNFEDGQEGIARAKAEIFSHPATSLAVVSAKALSFAPIREAPCPKVTFGPGGDIVVRPGFFIEEKGVRFGPFSLPFSEEHLGENFLAAASTARQLGLSWDEIFERAPFLKAPALRFEKIEKNGILFINDCYNAQIDAMIAALSNLPQHRMGAKTVAVFGEMVDLGRFSEAAHIEVAEFAKKRIDHALCYGKGCLPMIASFNAAQVPAEFFNSLADLKEALFNLVKTGDVVLIKGSRGNKLWQLLE